ncbi:MULTISPECIES: FixH family protein [unclassified Lentimicrobium]|uniref:FixH family protein n=1 Tax=unclassified Lentimicrobium TaxID=2677434 RepID=UPI0015549F2B|nr:MULTISPECIES: FixH family protein [unclassified Lentimicrobium]NPD46169.1 hypothetical protein [Lentimicrobium sp. S6]NPD83220.1 hypothetical protein [Lentimicrobium sp. L6]
MKIKWNWGTGIFLAILAMMAFVFLLVFKSFDYKINKVSEDYYERGLNHTEQMQRVENTRLYAQGFSVIYSNDCLVKFPEYFIGKKLEGQILFFRPSDFDYDRSFEINLDENGTQTFQLDYFLKGRYIVKVTFEHESVPYYLEEEIIFN